MKTRSYGIGGRHGERDEFTIHIHGCPDPECKCVVMTCRKGRKEFQLDMSENGIALLRSEISDLLAELSGESNAPRPYNGHANYETWLIVTWLRNDEGMADMVSGAGNDPRVLASRIHDKVDDQLPDLDGPWAALLNAALSEVDWVGVAKYFIQQEDA